MTGRCPNCHECDFPRGVCERVTNRGRRFFLMGALALPVARQIERVAAIVPTYEAPTITPVGRINVNGQEWTWDATSKNHTWSFYAIDGAFRIAT